MLSFRGRRIATCIARTTGMLALILALLASAGAHAAPPLPSAGELQACQIERRAGELLDFREHLRGTADQKEHALAKTPSFESLFLRPHRVPSIPEGGADPRKERSERLARAAEALDSALDSPIPTAANERERHISHLGRLLTELEAALQDPLRNRLQELYGESDVDALLATGGATCEDPSQRPATLTSRALAPLAQSNASLTPLIAEASAERAAQDLAFAEWCRGRREARKPAPDAEALWTLMHPSKHKASSPKPVADGKAPREAKEDDSNTLSEESLAELLRAKGVKFVMKTPPKNQTPPPVRNASEAPTERRTALTRSESPPPTAHLQQPLPPHPQPSASAGALAQTTTGPPPGSTAPPSATANPQALRCEAKPTRSADGAAADVTDRDCGTQTTTEKKEAEKRKRSRSC